MNRIQLIQGDITKLQVDAIVNAANTSLLGGGGVDGAIHRAAGPRLLDECRSLKGCRTGEAKITGAYNLPAKYVIHTVGPVWHGGSKNEAQLLANCYYHSLKLASEYHIESVAFPNISTGVYCFPKLQAAQIAINEVKIFIEKNTSVKKIIFCAFDTENFELYKNLLQQEYIDGLRI